MASSISEQKAIDFCEKVKVPTGVATYDSYVKLVLDPRIDIIYVATPISHHFQNAMLAL